MDRQGWNGFNCGLQCWGLGLGRPHFNPNIGQIMWSCHLSFFAPVFYCNLLHHMAWHHISYVLSWCTALSHSLSCFVYFVYLVVRLFCALTCSVLLNFLFCSASLTENSKRFKMSEECVDMLINDSSHRLWGYAIYTYTHAITVITIAWVRPRKGTSLDGGLKHVSKTKSDWSDEQTEEMRMKMHREKWSVIPDGGLWLLSSNQPTKLL